MKNVFYTQAQIEMKENNFERLVLNFIPTESDAEEIIENLKEDNIQEIIITDNAGLIQILGVFLKHGFKVECSVKQKMNKWGTTKEGLLLTK